MNKNFLRRTLAVLAVSAFAWSCTSCGNTSVQSMTADTFKVEKQDIENFISVSGTVEGSNIVKITSEISTKVKTLNVEVGSSVKEGDILCVFDSSDFQTEFDSLNDNNTRTTEKLQSLHEINQRTLKNAESNKQLTLSQAQRAIDKAVEARDKAYNRYNELATKKDDLYNKYQEQYNLAYGDEASDSSAYMKYQEYYQQYQAAETEYDTLGDSLSTYDSAVQDAKDAYTSAEKNADLAIQSAKDSIEAEKYDTDNSIQTQLKKLQEKIDKCTVRAPKSGIITSLNVAEGSIPTTDAIMTIEDNSQLRIKAQIQEADILNVKQGQKAVITTTATGEEEFSGTVERVVNIMSGQKNNAITGETVGGGYSAEITIDDKDSNLLIGMSAKIKIIMDEKKDVIAVPYDSIMEDKDGNFSVFVAEGSGGSYTAKSVKVEKGMETSYLTEITSDTLKEGDLVISQPNNISEGQSIFVSGSYYDSQVSENSESDGE